MKKKSLLLVTAVLLLCRLSFAQVGIGTVTPHPSAKLDVTSTNTGMLIPRMTSAQRTAIVSPAKGLLVFDEETATFWFYSGAAWTELVATGSSATNWTLGGTNIYNANAGSVGIGTQTPLDKLTVKTPGASYGLTHTDGITTVGTWIGTNNFFPGGWVGTKSNHPLNFFTAGGVARMTILPNGNVGVGVTTPLFQLDVANRMRIRSGANNLTAGLWMNNPSNSNTIAFMGIADANTTGFYGNVSGWGLIMNTNTGNVGIGTLNPTTKLAVNGNIRSREIVVETINWPDYVFDEKYKLQPLHEVEKFIKQNKHLSNIPSAKEVEEKGLHIGDTQRRMMEKIEELMLYVIELNKKIQKLEGEKAIQH